MSLLGTPNTFSAYGAVKASSGGVDISGTSLLTTRVFTSWSAITLPKIALPEPVRRLGIVLFGEGTASQTFNFQLLGVRTMHGGGVLLFPIWRSTDCTLSAITGTAGTAINASQKFASAGSPTVGSAGVNYSDLSASSNSTIMIDGIGGLGCVFNFYGGTATKANAMVFMG
jgi:hypothetical protein